MILVIALRIIEVLIMFVSADVIKGRRFAIRTSFSN